MCVPAWHDPAVFAGLIGGHGVFAVTPTGDSPVRTGSYEDGTLIWRSRWVSASSVVECREALARPAATDGAVLLRDLTGVQGTTRLRIVLDPRDDYGECAFGEVAGGENGVWQGRTGRLGVRLHGLPEAEVRDGALVAEVDLQADERRSLALEVFEGELPGQLPGTAALWAETERAWREDVPDVDGLWAPRDVRQAYAVLCGLTSTQGGTVAAATTSLPERANADRNYDYRYVWIRDLAMIGQSVLRHGPHRLADQAVDFVTGRLLADGAALRPAYTVGGGPVPEQSDLRLPGYPGGVDHVGNPAAEQFQLDAFGESLLLFAAAGRNGGLGSEAWAAVRVAATAIAERHDEPDAGIWEIEPRRWAHSRLICAAGLRAVADLSAGSEGEPERWRALAARLVEDVDRSSLHPTGRWQRAPDDPRVDGALLLPVIRGTVAVDDPRAERTVATVLDDLGEEHFLYRYRHRSAPSLTGAEGAFLICGFHAAIALAKQGRAVEAARWFERGRAGCGPAGLFTEELDVVTRQLRGNLPQAFVHATLIEASVELSDRARTPGPASG